MAAGAHRQYCFHHRPSIHPSRPPYFLRGRRQKCAVPTACLAAGRHGRPHSSFRSHPRGNDGGGRRIYAVPSDGSIHSGCLADHRLDRGHHCIVGCAHGHSTKRHQTNSRLLHPFAAGLHGDGGGLWGDGSRHVSPHHARGLQGIALPWSGRGDLCLPP